MNNYNEDFELIRLFSNMAFIVENPYKEVKEPELTIDQLLDKYNDCMVLYKMFDDQEYLDAANDVMMELQSK